MLSSVRILWPHGAVLVLVASLAFVFYRKRSSVGFVPLLLLFLFYALFYWMRLRFGDVLSDRLIVRWLQVLVVPLLLVRYLLLPLLKDLLGPGYRLRSLPGFDVLISAACGLLFALVALNRMFVSADEEVLLVRVTRVEPSLFDRSLVRVDPPVDGARVLAMDSERARDVRPGKQIFVRTQRGLFGGLYFRDWQCLGSPAATAPAVVPLPGSDNPCSRQDRDTNKSYSVTKRSVACADAFEYGAKGYFLQDFRLDAITPPGSQLEAGSPPGSICAYQVPHREDWDPAPLNFYTYYFHDRTPVCCVEVCREK